MSGPEFINNCDWRQRASNAYNHLEQLEKVKNKDKETNAVIDHIATETSCLNKDALNILQSEMMDTYLNFQTHKDRLTVKVSSYLTCVKQGKPSKSNKVVKLMRDIDMFTSIDSWTMVNNSSVKSNKGGFYDKVLDDHCVNHADEVITKMIASTHGTNPNALRYGSRAGLMDKIYTGNDYRNLAFKFVLLLNQMKVLYTFIDATLHGQYHDVLVEYCEVEEILDACNVAPVVIDCTNLSDEMIPVLVVISKQWPQQYVSIGSGNKDIYSSFVVRDDQVFMFYSQRSQGQDNRIDGIVMPPDELWDIGIKLFSALGAIEQLFEVVKETRGLVPMINIFNSMNNDMPNNHNMGHAEISITYPKSRGTNYIPELHKQSPFTQPSQFVPSSASLLLDGLLAMQSVNNMHSIVEKLGLCNSNIYGSNLRKNEKFECVIRDHGYNYCTDRNKLRELICPWNPIVTNSGDFFRLTLKNYAMSCVEYFNNNEPTGMNGVMRMLCLPISTVQDKIIPLSTAENIMTDVDINEQTRTTYKTNITNITAAIRTNNWLKGVGVGDTIPFGGLSYVCTDDLPPLNNTVKEEIVLMSGVYKLANVVCTLDHVSSRKGATATRVCTLFVPKYIVEPKSEQQRYGGHKTSITRCMSSFTTKTQSRKLVATDPTIDIANTDQGTTTTTSSESAESTEPTVVAQYYENVRVENVTSELPLVIHKVVGDGNCGPRAVLLSVGQDEVRLEAMLHEYGVDKKEALQWDDDTLAALADRYNRNLAIYNEGDGRLLYMYDNAHKETIYLYRTGVDCEQGHYDMAVVDKAKGSKYVYNTSINAKKTKSKVDNKQYIVSKLNELRRSDRDKR